MGEMIRDIVKQLFYAAAVTFVMISSGFAGPIITNDSFEDIQITAANSASPADIPGWTHSGDTGDALLWNATYPICCGGTNSANTGEGNQFVTMGGGYVTATSAYVTNNSNLRHYHTG